TSRPPYPTIRPCFSGTEARCIPSKRPKGPNASNGSGGWTGASTGIIIMWKTRRASGTGFSVRVITGTTVHGNGSCTVFLLRRILRYGIRRIAGDIKFQLSPWGIPCGGTRTAGRYAGLYRHSRDRPQYLCRTGAGACGRQETRYPPDPRLPPGPAGRTGPAGLSHGPGSLRTAFDPAEHRQPPC